MPPFVEDGKDTKKRIVGVDARCHPYITGNDARAEGV